MSVAHRQFLRDFAQLPFGYIRTPTRAKMWLFLKSGVPHVHPKTMATLVLGTCKIVHPMFGHTIYSNSV